MADTVKGSNFDRRPNEASGTDAAGKAVEGTALKTGAAFKDNFHTETGGLAVPKNKYKGKTGA